MEGMSRSLSKEYREFVRTWRLPVIGGIILFAALTSPVIARMMPALVRSMQSAGPGAAPQFPDPIWRDAYGQWLKNLSQMIAFAVVLVAAGSVAGEVSRGTAVLVLTKPVSRRAFVVAKAAACFSLLVATVAAGTFVTQGMTRLLFDAAPWGALWGPTLVWLVFAALLVAMATLASTRLPGLGAAGVSVGAWLLISLLGFWDVGVRFSPAGLQAASTKLLAGQTVALAWPMISTVLLTGLILAWATRLFARREL